MRSLSGRFARLSATRHAREETRDLVSAQMDRLQPGWYVRAGETIWRHWRTALPLHLRLSKSTPARPARGGPARASAVIQRWLPPVVLRVRRGGSGTFSVAVAADDGGVVLLDPEHGTVGRTYGSGPVSAEYLMLRRRYERHLQSPRFDVVDGGSLLLEDFVQGAHFAAASPESQINAMRVLLQRYAALTKSEGESTCQDWVRSAVYAVATGTVSGQIQALLGGDVIALSKHWPLVPSATDASVKNLIIVRGDRPVPIDLGNLRLDPFFYYPIGVITMARGAVLEHYLNGGFDEQVAELFAAAGSTFSCNGRMRLTLLALRMALTSNRETNRAGPYDQATFDHAFHRRWSQLWSGQPPTLD